MNPPKPEHNDRDNKRAFRWAAIVAALLIVGALLFNVFWARKPPVNVDNGQPRVRLRRRSHRARSLEL